MKIAIHHESPGYQSYRAACVRSLFNAEASDFQLEVELPLDAKPWQIGLVVGPSGSGKSSLGAHIWGAEAVRGAETWPDDAPLIDAIAPDREGGDWQQVPAALSAVGLGDVPAGLRPYHALSTGEKFRASLARVVCEAPPHVVIDEFTSVVDRQVLFRKGMAAHKRASRLAFMPLRYCRLARPRLDFRYRNRRFPLDTWGVFNVPESSSTYSRPKGDSGRFLSRIII